ncbi:VCBS repeat-containing protein [Burkholderiales bacterium JOSHI_001]|nr:VCBS repeat-containing protein [Burkholderiales bacterium JOSHI_001]
MTYLINRRPTGTDVSRTINEDTRYTVKAADLGFRDYDYGQTMAGVRIDTLPKAGSLLLNGVAVAAGQLISRADLDAGKLQFVPAANAYGDAYAAFTFSVKDSAGAFDDCPNNFCINVCPVNDAPDARDDTATTAANTAVVINVKANDSDPDNTNAQLTVTQATLVDPSKGTVTINPDGTLNFKPAAGVTGTVEINYTLKDPGGLTDTAKVTVTVTAPPVDEDCVTFNFNGNSPTCGPVGNILNYTVSGVSVHVSAFARTDGDAGVWSKAYVGAYGGGLGVTDSAEGTGAGNTHTVDNDGGRSNYLVFEFNQQVVLDKAFLGYVVCDSDLKVWVGTVNNAYTNHVQLSDAVLTNLGFSEVNTTTLSTTRWAELNAGEVAGNVIVIAADPSSRSATLGSTNLIQNGSFEDPVVPSSGASFFNKITGWTAVGDTLEVAKSTTYGVTGSTGTQVLELDANKAVGSVYQDIATTAGKTYQLSLDVAQRYCTVAGTNTVEVWWRGAKVATIDPGSTKLTTYTFQVTGSGGNDRLEFREQSTDSDSVGGIIDNVRLFAYTAPVADSVYDYFKVQQLEVCLPAPANTPPDGADATRTIAEDGSYTVVAGDFGFRDADADAGQTLAAVRIDTLPGNGTLTLNGVAVTAGQLIGVAAINAGQLRIAPDANESGSPYASFGFSVQDSTGSFDTAPNTFTLNVTPVNDAPVARPDATTTPEDTPVTGNVLTNDSDIDDSALTVTSYTVNGTNTAAGAGVFLAQGVLVVNTDGSYTFNPARNFFGPVPEITYEVRDAAGATAQSTLRIVVTPVNDDPLANPDTNTTDEDTTLVVSAANGVITSTGRAAGADTDVENDPLTVSAVGNSSANVGNALQGAWGALVLNADGSYRYTPNAAAQALQAGQSRDDVFNYTVSDGQGGSASSTLTITVTGLSEGGPKIDVPDANGADAGDNGIIEAGTPVSGSFTVSAPDGLASVTVGATVLSPAQLAALGASPVTITTPKGTLTLISFDPTTGAVGYRYAAPAQNAPDGSTDSITVVVTDTAGGSASDALDIFIADTAPAVRADVDSVTEDAKLSASGNVISAGTGSDTLAADAAQVSAVRFGATAGALGSALAGAHGELTLNADGSYSYALNNTDPAVQALNAGQTLTEVFTYTLTDADGDASSTTLTITINGSSDGGPKIDVPDANGADAGDNSIIEAGTPVSGSFTVSAPDGLASVTVGGTVVTAAQLAALGTTPVTVTTPKGTLTLTSFDPTTGAVGYRYAAPAQNAPDGSTDSITVVVTDTAGGSASDALDIFIADTAPEARADVNSVTEDSKIAASGNVISADAGADTLAADQAEVSEVRFGANISSVGTPLAGAFGSLVLAANGSYTYTLNNASPAVQALKQGQSLDEVFTYTLTDADGDASTTTLTITVNGSNDAPRLAATVVAAALSEEGLALGNPDSAGSPDTTNRAELSGSLGVSDADGDTLSFALQAPTEALTSGGQAITWTGAGTGTLLGSAGSVEVIRVEVDATGYRVQLLAPLDHPVNPVEDQLQLGFGLTVSDGVASASATLNVTVEDDSPVALNVVQNVPKGAVVTNLMLVIDLSGSMNEESGVLDPTDPTGTLQLTRLQLQKQAVLRLLDEYDALGDVQVRLVTFSTRASKVGEIWVDVGTARSQIETLTAEGFTNYDAALERARDAFDDAGKLELGQNISYFFSDGQPTTADGVNFPAPTLDPATGTLGIQPGEEKVWTDFLTVNDITSYSLGLGGAGVVSAHLDPVAYDGARGLNTGGTVVTDLAQLTDTLLSTVTSSVTGRLSVGTGASGSAFGADQGAVSSLGVGSSRYNFDPETGTLSVQGANNSRFDASTHRLSVDLSNGGTLVVDMDDGTFLYTVPSGAGTPGSDQPQLDRFDFTLIDHDGDAASGSLSLARNGATLEGSGNSDVFRWSLADAGPAGGTAENTVTGFDAQAVATGGDVLDLRDLLQGETAATLQNYLDFETTASGTTLHVSSTGGFAGGNFSFGAQDLAIHLDTNLRSDLGLQASASDNLVINELLRRGSLTVDA